MQKQQNNSKFNVNVNIVDISCLTVKDVCGGNVYLGINTESRLKKKSKNKISAIIIYD